MTKHIKSKPAVIETDEEFVGYPHYSKGEDIYKKQKEEKDLDPEEPSKNKMSNDTNDSEEVEELFFNEEIKIDDLDIPGSELDDVQEEIGSEDEENNYYSLGGDNHLTDSEADAGN